MKVGGIKYINMNVHSLNYVQNCGLSLKFDIMHNALSCKLYKIIRNKIKCCVKNVQ